MKLNTYYIIIIMSGLAWFVFWLLYVIKTTILIDSSNPKLFFNVVKDNIKFQSMLTLGHYHYVINGDDGLYVRQNAHEKPVTYLPVGSLVILNKRYQYYNNSFPISYPINGWIIPKPDAFLIEAKTENSCEFDIFLDGVDLTKGDIPDSSINVESAYDCCMACRMTDKCQAWTFVNSDSSCWLKNGFYQKNESIKKAVISGIRTQNTDITPAISFVHSQLHDGNRDRDHDKAYYANIKSSGVEWTDQWPIGTGRIGALVGGMWYGEVIPISMEGFYVKPFKANAGDDEIINVRNMYKEAVNVTRKLLMEGKVEEAEEQMKNAISNGAVGMFQYLLDMTLVYSIQPLGMKVAAPTLAPVTANVNLRDNRLNKQKRVRGVKAKGASSKVVLLNGLSDKFEYDCPVFDHEETVRQNHSFSRTYNEIFSSNILDMKHGEVTGTYLVTAGIPQSTNNNKSSSSFEAKGESKLYVLKRVWFASMADDIIVGKIKCIASPRDQKEMGPIDHSKAASDNCLNGVMQMSRVIQPDGDGIVWDSNSWSLYAYNGSISSTSPYESNTFPFRNHSHSHMMAFNSTFIPTISSDHLTTVLCGVMIGVTSSDDASEVMEGLMGSFKDEQQQQYNQKFIRFSHFNEIQIMISIQTDGNQKTKRIEDFLNSTYTQIKTNKLQRKCWEDLERSVNAGYETLQARHRDLFERLMLDSALITFDASSSSASNYDDQKYQKDSSPEQSGMNDKEMNDKCHFVSSVKESLLCMALYPNISHFYTRGFNSMINFDKYLVLSSSSRSVSNLQGLWANGPSSAWNGDYHLNINLQMYYWPLNSIFGKELHHDFIRSPLWTFMKDMSLSGKYTAELLYAIQNEGWVGHGFIDNTFRMGINGDLQWSLCVTCGTWLALHAWDYLSYHKNIPLIKTLLIPLLRSAAEFYLEYTFLGSDGYMHTGPTTSPENSYLLFHLNYSQTEIGLSDKRKKIFGPKSRKFHFLTLSPALDMSILRQASLVYQFSIDWVIDESPDYDAAVLEMKSDIALASRFRDLVLNMINQGEPVVSDKTNQIMEYPYIMPSCHEVGSDPFGDIRILKLNTSINTELIGCGVSESFDRSHRHFSGLHWLFPGHLLPSNSGSKEDKSFLRKISKDRKNIYCAAEKTLKSKIDSGGGHTGWSAAWESCLWARLRRSDRVWDTLTKIASKYTSSNMLGLHPPLRDKFGDSEQCATCFHDETVKDSSYTRIDTPPAGDRSMSLADDSKFQIDANSGFLAAIVELLLQSHIPGVIHILPALPEKLSQGSVKNLQARGAITCSFDWREGMVQHMTMYFASKHYFLYGHLKEKPLKNSNFSLTIISPNDLSYAHINDGSSVNQHAIPHSCAKVEKSYSPDHESYVRVQSNCAEFNNNDSSQSYQFMKVTVFSFPCTLHLVDANVH